MSSVPQDQQDELITPREFAERQGFRSHYGNALFKAGRLVMAEDGKHCLYRASLKRFIATSDLSKAGVAARHAAAREAAATKPKDTAPPTAIAAVEQEVEPDEKVGQTYHASKAIKEKYLALAARRDYEKSTKLLLNAEDVYFHINNVMIACRINLEQLPTALSPQLAAMTDENKIFTFLSEHIEHILDIMSKSFNKLGD